MASLLCRPRCSRFAICSFLTGLAIASLQYVGVVETLWSFRVLSGILFVAVAHAQHACLLDEPLRLILKGGDSLWP